MDKALANTSYLLRIDGLVSSNTATTGNVIPLVSQLVGALSTATSAVGAVGSVSGGSTDVANAIAPIISVSLRSMSPCRAFVTEVLPFAC